MNSVLLTVKDLASPIQIRCKKRLSEQALRPINKWDLKKRKSFCTTKNTIVQTKQQSTEWVKIFTSYTSDRQLLSKTYKKTKKPGYQENNLKMGYISK